MRSWRRSRSSSRRIRRIVRNSRDGAITNEEASVAAATEAAEDAVAADAVAGAAVRDPGRDMQQKAR